MHTSVDNLQYVYSARLCVHKNVPQSRAVAADMLLLVVPRRDGDGGRFSAKAPGGNAIATRDSCMRLLNLTETLVRVRRLSSSSSLAAIAVFSSPSVIGTPPIG